MTHTSSHRPPARILKVCLATFVLALGIAGTAQAATFNVNNTDDTASDGTCDADCTLRDAVDEANATSNEVDTINVPAGRHLLDSNDVDIFGTGTGSLTIVGAGADATIVDGNRGDRVFDVRSSGTFAFSNLTVTRGDVSAEGGGIDIDNSGANVTLTNTTVRNNETTDGDGGGIYNDGRLTLNNSQVLENTIEDGDDGGGIYNDGPSDGTALTITNSSVSENYIEGDDGDGGGLYHNNGTARIEGSVFSNNRSAEDGGGIESWDPLTVVTTTIDSNVTGGEDDEGGGISQESGTLTVERSTISRNRSTDEGGGIDHDTSSKLTVLNSTISGNRAIELDADGGGIDNHNNSAFEVTNTTIANNVAGDEGGGVNDPDDPNFKNTIIANNRADEGNNCDGSESDNTKGHNLENPVPSGVAASDTCQFTTGTDLRADPVLGPLQNNGGPTETHALLSGSPAINSADNAACPATDQRGVSRPQEGTCDRGSYEVQPAAAGPAPAPGPVARDTRRPRVSVAGLRRACVSRNFRIRVRLRDESPLRRVHVYLDRRRIANTTRKSFRVTVRASRLRAGRHRIVIIARDVAGNRTRTVRRFRVCAARKVRRAPRFTG